MDNSRNPGLYVHIPFCSKRCGYCSFASGVYAAETVSEYLACVKREATAMARRGAADKPVDTVYFGGGTPSVLSGAEVAKLFSVISDRFRITNGSEISLEANPESLSATKLNLLKQLGINRLSIGVQSFDDDILKYLGRLHSSQDAINAVEGAKSAGFENLSVDLIYGIPGQTSEMWRDDIESAIRQEPEHISIYCLSLEPEVPLYGGVKPDWPDEDLQALMYFAARDALQNAGYVHYEISNFARPGFECRHNQKYWRDENYLGLGVAAAFHWNGTRYRNPPNITEYGLAVERGKWPLATPEISDTEREMRTAVVLGLRLIGGIDLAFYEKRFGVDILDYYGDTIDRLIESSLLEIDDGILRLTPQSLFISDEIFSELI